MSKNGFVIIPILLIFAVSLAVSGYVAYTYLIKPKESPSKEQTKPAAKLPTPSPNLEEKPSPSPLIPIEQVEEKCKFEDVLESTPYKKRGFKICYPKKWSINESGLAGTTVVFLNPQADQERNIPFYANFNVLASPSRGFDLDAYINDAKPNLPKIFPNYTLVEDKRITINGKTAHVLGATYMIDVIKIRNSQSVIVERGNVYIVTATTFQSTWDKYKDLFETSTLTFEIAY